MITIIDVENTIHVREDGTEDYTPYNANNYLVSVGYGHIVEGCYQHGGYLVLRHNEVKVGPDVLALRRQEIQDVLDKTTLLVAHNLKYDLAWLLESDFTYEGDVYCTQVGEYILHRGVKGNPLSLAGISEARKVYLKKSDLVQKYLDDGVQFNAIPLDTVIEYGSADCQSCGEVYLAQQNDYNRPDTIGMRPVLDMSMDFCRVLTDIERAGNAVDIEALDQVEKDYYKEKEQIETRLREIVYQVMGDMPISLTSNDDLSKVIYSRAPIDKHRWKEIFNLGLDLRGKPKRRPHMPPTDFANIVRNNTTKVYRQTARQCGDCGGVGKFYPTTKKGLASKKYNLCKTCFGVGIKYTNTDTYAGFKLTPGGVEDVAVAGFASNKDTLKSLLYKTENPLAKEFLTKMMRLSAVEVYLNSFCAGIRRGVQANGILHPRLNQTVTATARLSSADPNFQNQPRGSTFPIRRVVRSRWYEIGGEIIEADYSGLEFVVAGELSNDPVIAEMKRTKQDAHKKTATIIHRCVVEDVDKEMRQAAKEHTFAPLYGAMGMGYPDYIQRYYQTFTTVYPGVGRWHKEIQNEAISTKKVVLPSGRQYAFPYAQRQRNGGATSATQIKNYPVQGGATADIVPVGVIRLWRLLRLHNCKSVIINTVHDSVVVDRHPDDSRELIIGLMYEALSDIKGELWERFKWDFKLPLDIEVAVGPNWLDKKEIHYEYTIKNFARQDAMSDELPF